MKILSPIIVGALALAASVAFADSDTNKVKVSVGYANNWDGYNQNHHFVPYPWDGGVDIFQGAPVNLSNGGSVDCLGNCYDTGVILLSNPSGSPLTVNNVNVDIGLTNFKPAGWTFPIIIPAYGTMILAQTSAWDFESSNVNTGCTPDGKIPVVHVSVGSSPVRNFIDKTQVLNTGGYDKSGSGCGGYAEGHPFVALKTKDGSDD